MQIFAVLTAAYYPEANKIIHASQSAVFAPGTTRWIAYNRLLELAVAALGVTPDNVVVKNFYCELNEVS